MTAVEGGEEQPAPRREQGSKGCQEGGRIGHVLDDLERRDDRKARALGQQVLGDADTVGERQALPLGVGAGRLDRLAGGIQTQDVEATPGQCLRRNAGTAAHVEQPQRTLQRRGWGWG